MQGSNSAKPKNLEGKSNKGKENQSIAQIPMGKRRTTFPNVILPQSEGVYPKETLTDSHPVQATGVHSHPPPLLQNLRGDSPSFAPALSPDFKAKQENRKAPVSVASTLRHLSVRPFHHRKHLIHIAPRMSPIPI